MIRLARMMKVVDSVTVGVFECFIAGGSVTCFKV